MLYTITILLAISLIAQSEPVDRIEFQNSALAEHNQIRRSHGAQDLRLNSDLNRIAQNYADKLASTKSGFKLSYNRYKGVILGENIAIGSPIFTDKLSPG